VVAQQHEILYSVSHLLPFIVSRNAVRITPDEWP